MNVSARIVSLSLGLFLFADATLAQTPLQEITGAEIVVGVGHSDEVRSIAFSPDGQVVATGSNDRTIKLWDLKSGRELRTIMAPHAIDSIAFSPDGRQLASADASDVRLWDVLNGRQIREFKIRDRANNIAFSPDGRTIVCGGFKLRLLDVESGTVRLSIDDVGVIFGVAYSPNGRIVAAGGSDNTLMLFDQATGQRLRTMKGHKLYVQGIAFSPNSRVIATGSYDKTIMIWDADSGQLLRTLKGHSDYIWNNGVAFSPDGQRVISGGFDQTIKMWDPASGRLLRSVQGKAGAIFSVRFSADGRSFAYSGKSNVVRLNDASNGSEVRELSRLSHAVSAIALSPRERSFLSASDDGAVHEWDFRTGTLTRSLSGQSSKVNSVGYSSDGASLLSAGNDEVVVLWDAVTGAKSRTIKSKYGAVVPVAVRWDVSIGKPVYSNKYVGGITAAGFSPDGKTIVAAGGIIERSGLIKYWDSTSGREVRSFTGHRDYISSIAISPDGRMLATASADKTAKLWDLATARELRTFSGHTGWLTAIAFSPDGRTVATGDKDTIVLLWDVETGKQTGRFAGHWGGAITAVSFSPDGRSLASASEDKTIKIWDLASGRETSVLTGHGSGVTAVAFSPDGQTIISGGADSTSRIWTVGGELLATSIAAADGSWLTITPEGFFSGSTRGFNALTIVSGLRFWFVDQFYQALYRPDLVREKLSGDPRGLVREAAAKLDLGKIIASGNAPTLAFAGLRDGERVPTQQIEVAVDVAAREGGVGRVEWRVNGVTVGVDTPSTPTAGQPLRLTRGLSLDEGDNQIEVVAHNNANLVASVPARIGVTAPAAAGAARPRLFVLTLGLNDYAEANLKLNFAVADAQALAQAFTKAGEGLYESVDVTLLRDGEVTQAGIDKAMTALAAKVQPSDVFLFYLAGHGVTIDGRYYFVPQNMLVPAGVNFTRAELTPVVVKEGIPQEQWQRWFASIPAKRSVLLLDTCESGSLAGEEKETRALERGAANDRLAQATGRSVIAASSDTQDAHEGYRGHGLFTYNLLEALDQADGDGNGKIELGELAAYVYAQVTAISEQVFDKRQAPQMRIANAGYSLANRMTVFAGQSNIAIAVKPTHQIAVSSELLIQPAFGAPRVRKLDAKTAVTLVKSEAGWTLIAKEGRPLGYVATRDLAPLQ